VVAKRRRSIYTLGEKVRSIYTLGERARAQKGEGRKIGGKVSYSQDQGLCSEAALPRCCPPYCGGGLERGGGESQDGWRRCGGEEPRTLSRTDPCPEAGPTRREAQVQSARSGLLINSARATEESTVPRRRLNHDEGEFISRREARRPTMDVSLRSGRTDGRIWVSVKRRKEGEVIFGST